MSSQQVEQEDYPGKRRGLPETGPGAVAGWGRRVLALVIDWTLSMLAVGAFAGQGVWNSHGAAQWAPIAVFGLECSILVTLLGGSAGQLICGIAVRRTSGAPLDLFRALLRTALLCLVLPALFYNQDQQGLHDLAADSIVLRR